MFDQSLAKIDRDGGVKGFLAQSPVQSKSPTAVTAQQFDRFPVRDPFGVLQDTYPQQEHRFNGRGPVASAISFDQDRTRLDESRIDLLHKDAESVGRAEKLVGPDGDGKESGLGVKSGRLIERERKGLTLDSL